VTLAIEELDSRDAGQRANAMETLDAVGEAKIVRPLLPLWEMSDSRSPETADFNWLLEALSDDNCWIRACAAFAAARSADHDVVVRLAEMAQSDPDDLVRKCAMPRPDGETKMETVNTLSTVEQVLFLRRVQLFAELPPDDLRQIASVAEEITFEDGAAMARQGEPGDILFIIVSGEVLVTSTDDAGSQIELGRRHTGEYVGEMAIISDEKRMATLTAAGSVRTLSISQKQFREILRLRPEVALAVMAGLAHRLREQYESAPMVAEN
jgi:hypothetical protein